jgi:hypothetical protein
MNYLVVNADDFGACAGMNRGVGFGELPRQVRLST